MRTLKPLSLALSALLLTACTTGTASVISLPADAESEPATADTAAAPDPTGALCRAGAHRGAGCPVGGGAHHHGGQH